MYTQFIIILSKKIVISLLSLPHQLRCLLLLGLLPKCSQYRHISLRGPWLFLHLKLPEVQPFHQRHMVVFTIHKFCLGNFLLVQTYSFTQTTDQCLEFISLLWCVYKHMNSYVQTWMKVCVQTYEFICLDEN